MLCVLVLTINFNDDIMKDNYIKVLDRRDFPKWPLTEASLEYDWDMNGNNKEWRICVKDVIRHFQQSYTVELVDEPEFYDDEDFVDIRYKINGCEIVFSNDATLFGIWLSCKNITLLRELENYLIQIYGFRE